MPPTRGLVPINGLENLLCVRDKQPRAQLFLTGVGIAQNCIFHADTLKSRV